LRFIGILLGIVLGLYGLFRIDYVLYEGLNYFGKYVFFTLFNLFVLYVFWFFYKRFSGWVQPAIITLYGLVIFLISYKLV